MTFLVAPGKKKQENKMIHTERKEEGKRIKER